MAAGSIVIDLLMKTGSFITDTARAEKSLKNFQKTTIDLTGTLKSLLPALSVGAITAWAKSNIDAADAINDLSLRTGQSVELLAGLQEISAQSGTDIDNLATAFNKLSVSIGKANDDGESTVDALKALGITAKDPYEILLQLSDAYQRMGVSSEFVKNSQVLLGKSYQSLLPLLANGRQGIEDSVAGNAEYARTMGVLAKQADTVNDQLETLNTRYKQVSGSLLVSVLPAFVDYMEDVDKIIKKHGLLAGSISAVGGAIFYAFEGSKMSQAETRMKTLRQQMDDINDIAQKIRDKPENKGKSIDELGFLSRTQIKNLATDYNKLGDELRVVQREYESLVKKATPLPKPKPTAETFPLFGDLTKDLKTPSQLKSQFDSESKAIIDAAKREGKTTAELTEALKGLREKIYGKATVKAPKEEINYWANTASELANFVQKAQDAIRPAETLSETMQRELNSMTNLDSGYKSYLQTLVNAVSEQEKFKEAIDEAVKSEAELNAILNQTPTAKLEEQRSKIKDLYLLLDDGRLKFEQFGEAVDVVLGRTAEVGEKTFTLLEAAAKKAGENMQSALADFLFDPFKEGLDGMLSGFINVLKRMAAEALAVQIFKSITSNFGGDSGVGAIVSAVFGGAKAGGGDVMSGKSYLVGEQGPEMFVPRTAGSIMPSSALTQPAPQVNVRNINVLDPSLVGDYLGTDSGEQLIMNVVQRNKRALA